MKPSLQPGARAVLASSRTQSCSNVAPAIMSWHMPMVAWWSNNLVMEQSR